MDRSVTLNGSGRVVLILGAVLPALAITALIPVLPTIERHFSGQPDSAGLARALVSALSLAMIVGSAGAGLVADRFGARPILLLGLALYAGAGVAAFVTDSLPLLLASRILVGLAAALVNIVVYVLVIGAFEGPQRDRWMGWMAAAGTIGSLFVVALAGWLGNIDWRLVFLLHLVALPAIALVLVGVRIPARSSRPAAETKALSPPLTLRIWIFVALIGIGGGAINSVPMFLPFHVADTGQTAPSAIALAMLSSAATGAVACLLYGRIMHWLSPITVFVLGFVIGGTGLLLISQSSQYLLILAAAAVSGAGLGITIPNMNTMAALVSTPTNRGAVIGLAHGALFGGAPLVQFGFDFLIGSQSAGRAILLLGCMAWLLVGLWLLLGGKLLPAAPEPAPLPAG